MGRTPRTPEDRARGGRVVAVLKAKREASNLTAAEVSSLARVPLDTVRAIESGRVLTPSFLVVAAIGKAVGVSLDELAAAIWEGE